MIRLFTILLAIVVSNFLTAQNIPNGSFENWTGNLPTGWTSANGAQKLTSVNVTGTNSYTITPLNGAAFASIKAVQSGTSASLGFIYLAMKDTTRPVALRSGFFYLPQLTGESFVVSLFKFKRNGTKRDTVSLMNVQVSQVIPNWSILTVNIAYKNALKPDSTFMILQTLPNSQGQLNLNTIVGIDALQFVDYAAGIDDLTFDNIGKPIKLNIAPNPTYSNGAKLSFFIASPSKTTITITDMQGKIVSNQSVLPEAGNNVISLNTSKLSKGIYSVNVTSTQGTRNSKLMVQ